jgi:hypothetical protein
MRIASVQNATFASAVSAHKVRAPKTWTKRSTSADSGQGDDSIMPDKKRRSVRSVAQRASESTIAARAYAKWVARGCPDSDGLEDWFAAQTELERSQSAKRLAKQVQP